MADNDDLPRHRFFRLPDDLENRERVIQAVPKLDPDGKVFRDTSSIGSIIELRAVPAQVLAMMMGCTANTFSAPK